MWQLSVIRRVVFGLVGNSIIILLFTWTAIGDDSEIVSSAAVKQQNQHKGIFYIRNVHLGCTHTHAHARTARTHARTPRTHARNARTHARTHAHTHTHTHVSIWSRDNYNLSLLLVFSIFPPLWPSRKSRYSSGQIWLLCSSDHVVNNYFALSSLFPLFSRSRLCSSLLVLRTTVRVLMVLFWSWTTARLVMVLSNSFGRYRLVSYFLIVSFSRVLE